MFIKNLKTWQAICGSIMVILLATYLYMNHKLAYEGIYYNLTKGFFQIFLALTWHFILLNTKITKPEKYNRSIHLILVIIWGGLGVIKVIDTLVLLL